MKHSEIYRAAANHVAEKTAHGFAGKNLHYPCCKAINVTAQIMMGRDCIEQMRARFRFEKYFKPKGKNQFLLWFGPVEVEENRDIRVLALLFMAAIAESEGN